MRKFVFLALGTGVLSLSGCSSNRDMTEATVVGIDRSCKIITSRERPVEGGEGAKDRVLKEKVGEHWGPCKSVDEWEKVRSSSRRIAGKAAISITYRDPVTQSFHAGTINFDGLDDEFYRLKIGDRMKIWVNRDDPKNFTKA